MVTAGLVIGLGTEGRSEEALLTGIKDELFENIELLEKEEERRAILANRVVNRVPNA
jgi:hypothetical protein